MSAESPPAAPARCALPPSAEAPAWVLLAQRPRRALKTYFTRYVLGSSY